MIYAAERYLNGLWIFCRPAKSGCGKAAQRLLRQSLKPDFRPVIKDGEDIKDQ